MNCELCSAAGQGDETRCRKCGFDTSLPADVKRFLTSLTGFRPGDLLDGRFRIDRILGFGGMSVVYKARDEMLGEDVAIKVINDGRVADGAKLFTDIRRDIVTTRKLAHPDIVKVHDLHKTDSSGFLTMEYVKGKDLATLIAERGKLEETEVCRLAMQVAEALGYAHANGVVHCDIKPGNLLLTEAGRVKIADFGISRVLHEENTGLTGLVVGTPAYMSPEQIRGERPTPLTDMYALGIVMWHCLMGAPPYTRGDIGYQHVHVPLPPLEGVSPELERIIRKAASKEMADRYPSLDVMAQELRQFLRLNADATIVQTPPPRLADTIMQTPPPQPAATIMRTPPPQPAATIMQTPPPQPARAGIQSPPSQPAIHIAAAPPPAPPPPVTPGREAMAGVGPAGGAPAGGGPPAGTAGSFPAAPIPSANTRVAWVAAVAVVLIGAALWAFFPRSRQAGPGETGSTPGGNAPPAGNSVTGVVGSTEGGAARGGISSGSPSPPADPTPAATQAFERPRQAAVRPQPAPERPRPAAVSPQPAAAPPQSAVETPQSPVPVARSYAPAGGCKKPACFEFFDAVLTPAVARPGDTVRCTAHFTFSHNEGGTKVLEVEESVQLGVRFSRGVSHRIKAGAGTNLFDISFKVPARVSAGVYPVTASIRRRSTTETVKLNLVVTK